MKLNNFKEEYFKLAHAIQTGVAYDHEGGSLDGSPKHLRTGLNIAMSDHTSLACLLIKKGIITESEYEDALLIGLKEEVKRYEKQLSEKFNTKVILG